MVVVFNMFNFKRSMCCLSINAMLFLDAQAHTNLPNNNSKLSMRGEGRHVALWIRISGCYLELQIVFPLKPKILYKFNGCGAIYLYLSKND